MNSVELRQHKRYRLVALVTFEWQTNDGTIRRSEGQTRDLSPAGVFVTTAQTLPIGTAVRMEVALPGLLSERLGPRLKTQAHVIRSERSGFAAIADVGFRLRVHGTDAARKNNTSKKDEGGIPATIRTEFLQH
jgi:hypothetical protein